MGDRSQVCIKSGESKVYLYGHWIGSDIYKAVGAALQKAPDRHDDSEYLARVVFQKMLGDDDDTSGFGIGTQAHGDIEHAIPILDCDTGHVSFERSSLGSMEAPEPIPFNEFMERALKDGYAEF